MPRKAWPRLSIMRLALDVMGGDHGAGRVISGALAALHDTPAIRELVLVGDESEIHRSNPEALRNPRVRIVHASEVVTMGDGPMEVLRRKKHASG